MANYTMQCKRCGVNTDYSSKTDLCDACEIKTLRAQLSTTQHNLAQAEGVIKRIDEEARRQQANWRWAQRETAMNDFQIGVVNGWIRAASIAAEYKPIIKEDK